MQTTSHLLMIRPAAFAPNRRMEREKEVMECMKKKFKVRSIFDLTNYEREEVFLPLRNKSAN